MLNTDLVVNSKLPKIKPLKLFSRSMEVLRAEIAGGAFQEEKFSTYSFLVLGESLKHITVNEFDVLLEVPRRSLISVFCVLRHHSLLNFDFLVDIVSWDKPGERFRFSILYYFLSVSRNTRFSVLCQTREGVPLESVSSLYHSSS